MKQGFFKRNNMLTTSNNWPLILQALADLTEDQVNAVADSFKTPCPLCNRRSCYVFRGGEDGNWSCLHCGKGDGWTLLQKVNGWDFTVALNEINSFVQRGAILPVLTRKPRAPRPELEYQDSIRNWIDRFNQELQPSSQESSSREPLSQEPEQTSVPVELSPKPEDELDDPIQEEEVINLAPPKPESRQIIGDEREKSIIRRFSAQSIGQIIRDIQPTNWLINNFLEQTALAQFSAPPAGGKSFLAVDIAASVATGKDFHSLTTRQGLVFYIPGNGLTDMKKRFRAWELHNQTEIAGSPLFLLPQIPDAGLSAYFSDAGDEMERVARTRNLSPRLIIIDISAHHVRSGDEMALVAERARAFQCKFGCCVLLTGESWTASRALLDAEYQILRQEDSMITVQPVKMKDGELAAPMELALISAPIGLQDENGQQITCAVLTRIPHDAITADHLTAMDGRRRGSRLLTQAQETVLQVIHARAASSGQVSYQEVLDEIKSQGGSVSNYARTVNALIQRNLITMTGDELMPVVEMMDQ